MNWMLKPDVEELFRYYVLLLPFLHMTIVVSEFLILFFQEEGKLYRSEGMSDSVAFIMEVT